VVQSSTVSRYAFANRVTSVCAFGQMEIARVVPRYPLRNGSSCDIIDMGVCPTRMLARRDWRADSGSFLRFRDCTSFM